MSADIGLNNTRMTVRLRCYTPLVGLHATSHHKSVGQTSKRLNRSTDWTSNIICGNIVVGWITEKGAFVDAKGYIYWRPKSQLILYLWMMGTMGFSQKTSLNRMSIYSIKNNYRLGKGYREYELMMKNDYFCSQYNKIADALRLCFKSDWVESTSLESKGIMELWK